VAALPVWANAENVNVTAMARRTRRKLLFIGSVVLLGTWVPESVSGMNFNVVLRIVLVSQRWAALKTE
jgi:hypothetical protein